MTIPSFNSVRLIGRVCKRPVSIEADGESFLRVVLEVDEQDEGGALFSSYHVVILSDEMVAADGGVNLGDMIMIDGRLNNYRLDSTGQVSTNVHAKAILVLVRNGERVEKVLGRPNRGSFEDAKEAASFFEQKVVQLFGGDGDEVIEDEPPF